MAVFHLQASFGSRVGGQSAAAKADYIEREGRYDGDAAELEHSESGNMPEWAEDDPHAYWEAADAHERANGRLYSELQFALPVELDEGQRRDLASTFAQQMTGGERLPYTLAMHRGGGGESALSHDVLREGERRDRAQRGAVVPALQRQGPGEGRGAEVAGGQGWRLVGQDPRDVGARSEPGAGAGGTWGADRSPQLGREAGGSESGGRPGAGGRAEPGAECPPRP